MVEVAEALTVISGRTEVGPTKSYARRTVGLPRSICEDFGEFLTLRARERGCPPAPADYVFTAPRGGPLRRVLLLKRSAERRVGKDSVSTGIFRGSPHL